jgi:protein-S-isoprenylcysteine O-methyltransferase Ste14
MLFHSYVVLADFTLLLVAFIWQVLRIRPDRSDWLGTAPIPRRYFYSAKVALFITWGLFIVKAISPRLGYITVPGYLSWTAVGLLLAGSVIFMASIISLGTSLAVGLPEQTTHLKTGGFYRFSRNPVYLAVFLVSAGSCLYYPDLINVSLTIYGIYVHHQIILQEERFLEDRFGNDWSAYASRVRRYL